MKLGNLYRRALIASAFQESFYRLWEDTTYWKLQQKLTLTVNAEHLEPVLPISSNTQFPPCHFEAVF